VQSAMVRGDSEAGTHVARRPIWLCADDYGISLSVNKAIRDLIMRGRLNATSVMVAAPSLNRSESASLNMLNAGSQRVAIGLHVTLTAPFRPLSEPFVPLRDGAFLPHQQMLARGALRLLDRRQLAVEISTQLQVFTNHFGRAPDFIDGHQHVHLFPQVREALLAVVKEAAPRAWVRQCGRAVPWLRRLSNGKALVLDLLSNRFRSQAGGLGIATNPAFAGAYNFASPSVADFEQVFSGFLEGLPAQSVVMCHPGFVDAELERLDRLTVQREREYAFLAGDTFPGVLKRHGAVLA
jgi:predicted glycoside hydrolase/deacetylase ChbG (UPF0249 family)